MEQNSPEYTSTVQSQNFLGAIFASQDDEAESLCQLLTDVDRPLLLQLAALEDLRQIPPEFAESSRVDNPDELLTDIRWWAIRGLAICGNRDSIASLAEYLTDKNPELRSVAALSIGHIGQRCCSHPSVEPAETALIQKPTFDWRSDVENALHGISALLNDPVGYVRQTASDALVLFGAAAVPTLQSVLSADSEPARVRAAYALRKIGTKSALVKETAPALFQLLNDPNYLVHTYAHEALDEMGLLDNVLVVL